MSSSHSAHSHQQQQLIRQQIQTNNNSTSSAMSGADGHHSGQISSLIVEQQQQVVASGDQPSTQQQQQINPQHEQVQQEHANPDVNQTVFQSHVISGPTVVSHQGHHHRSASTGSDQFRSIIEQVSSQQIISSSHPAIFSFADHIDDDNDLFECGKCKQHFNYLNSFLQHKKLCNSRKNTICNEKLRRELAEIELHLGIASSSQNLIHTGHHHSIGKSLLSSSSANSSPLLIQSTNNSPTSMLNVTGVASQTNPLAVDVGNHRHQHHHHQNRSSPLVDPLNGSAMVNSILPDTDLLSLASSLDANMIASIGNSISPSSLLHLQGGDVSSNTDDFAQFAHLNHIDASTEAGIGDVHQVQSRTNTTGLYGTSLNNGTHSMLNSLVSSSTASSISSVPISVSSHHHQQQQPQPSMNVINFMNTINPSPTSFTSFIQNLSSTEVIGSSPSMLKTPFDGDGESTSNDNSIGSPSRFLNLPPPSTPSSIIEHRPNQSSVRSTQTSSTATSSTETQKQKNDATVTMNVIHHSQQQQHKTHQIMITQTQPSVVQQMNDSKNVVLNGKNSTNKASFMDNQQTTNNVGSNSNEPNFKCSFCDRSFNKSNELANHIPCHTGEKPYQCCICGKAFGQKNNLRKHIMTHRISKEEYQIAYKTSVDQSMKNIPKTSKAGKAKQQQTQQPTENTTSSSNETIIYICPLKCGFNSDSLDSLKIHCSNEHQTPLVTDNSTTNVVQQQQAVEANDHQITSGSGLPPLINPSQISVDAAKTNPAGLIQIKQEMIPSPTNNHPTTMNAPRSSTPPQFKVQDKFTCPIQGCGFVSTKETEFKMHCVDHTVANDENIRYRCTANDCQEVYINIEAYIKHLQSHDRALYKSESEQNATNESIGKSRIYRCQTCLNRYTTQNALENHKATSSHHYPCQHCNKVFPCERYLRRHLLTHGAGLFICNYCDKSFKTANYLKVHLIIHTGEKPFACKICDAAFNRRDKLKRHELVHDPVKRYKCPMNSNGCKREFNRPDKLKAHILTHSGVKPYQCSMCTRSFTRRAHLREHCKTHQDFVDAINKANIDKFSTEAYENSTGDSNDNNNSTKTTIMTVTQTTTLKNEDDRNKVSLLRNSTNIVETINNSVMNPSVTFTTTFATDDGQQQQMHQHLSEESLTSMFDKDGSMQSTSSLPSLKVEQRSSSIDNSQSGDHLADKANASNEHQTNSSDSIILFTGPTSSSTTSTTANTTNYHQVMTEASKTTSNSNTSQNATTSLCSNGTVPATTTGSAGNNNPTVNSAAAGPLNPPIYLLMYSCPKCKAYFFKEEEINDHKCFGGANNKSTTEAIGRNSQQPTQQLEQSAQPILVPVTSSTGDTVQDNNSNNNPGTTPAMPVITATATTTTTTRPSNQDEVQIKTEIVFEQ